MPRPTYLSKDGAYDPNEDKLLKAARAVQILDTLDSMDRRDQQSAMQLKQYELQIKQQELQTKDQERLLKKQELDINSQLSKTSASNVVADFSSSYDPTDVEHRSKAEWVKNWAMGQGMTAQEINQGFSTIDQKNIGLDNYLKELQRNSGITDWERTPDGKRIDVRTTELKALQQKQDLDTAAKTWTNSDRRLEKIIAENNPNMGTAERMIQVNQSRQALTDYQNLIADELWNPSQDFEGKFKKPTQLINSDPQKPQSWATEYDWDALQSDRGYIKAKQYQNRIAAGETPILLKDDKGITQYDPNTGVALVKEWVDLKQRKAVTDIRSGEAEATIKEQDAKYAVQFGSTSKTATAISNIARGMNEVQDPAARANAQNAINALTKELPGASKTPANNKPTTKGDSF